MSISFADVVILTLYLKGTNLRLKCYDAFKEAFPDTWQNILELHEEAALFLGVPQTVAARAQEFHKFGKRLSAMVCRHYHSFTVVFLKPYRWMPEQLATDMRLHS